MKRVLRAIGCAFLSLCIAGCGDDDSNGGGVPGGGESPGGNGNPPAAQQFVYVGNGDVGSISGFSIGADGMLTALSNSPFSGAAQGLASTGRDLVFSSEGFRIVSWRVEQDGSLTRGPTWSKTEPGGSLAPGELTVEPSGRNLYAHIFGPSEGLAVFNVATSGALTPDPPLVAIGGVGKPEFTEDGTTGFVPIGIRLTTSIGVLARDVNTGGLTQTGGFGYPQAEGKGRVAVSPDGNFLAHATGTGSLGMFLIDPATQILTAVAGSPFSFGSDSGGVAWSPNGRFVLVASGEGLRVFRIDSTGRPTEVTGQPGPGEMSNVFVTGSNIVIGTSASAGTVSTYRLDPSSGRLTEASVAQASGAGANEITVVAR